MIKNNIGIRCLQKEDGIKIYDEIYNLLQKGEKVTLDFTEVRQFTSLFFNFAIGHLLKDFSEEALKRQLEINNLNDVGETILKRVIKNASRYYSDEEHSKAINAIIDKQAHGSL